MKKNILNKLLATTVLMGMVPTTADAQSASNTAKTWGVKNPLFDKVAGKLNLTGNVGYVYNFASKWDSEIGTGKANGGFGYGARLGWTHNSGFGLSGDYLGFTSKWSNDNKEYTNPYHVITITPSYRFSFGQSKEWGLKVGLGIGISLADVSWIAAKDYNSAKGTTSKVAGGAIFEVKAKSSGYVNDLSAYVNDLIPTDHENINNCVTRLDSLLNPTLRIADSNTGITTTGGFSVANGCYPATGNPVKVSGAPDITDANIAAWLIAKGVRTNAAGTALDSTSLSNAKIFLSSAGGEVASGILTAVKAATDAADAQAAKEKADALAAIAKDKADAVAAALAAAKLVADAAAAQAAIAAANEKAEALRAAQANADAAAAQAAADAAAAKTAADAAAAKAVTDAAAAKLAADNALAAAKLAADNALAAARTAAELDKANALAAAKLLADADKANALAAAKLLADAEKTAALALAAKDAAAEKATAVAQAAASTGSAKDDAGFVLAPEIALEYDNGLLHADINARYIHGLANVKYDGQGSTGNQLQKSGPLAIFIGAGFGVNF